MTIQEFFEEAEKTVKDDYYCSFKYESVRYSSGDSEKLFSIYCSYFGDEVVFYEKHADPEILLNAWKAIRETL